MIDRLIESHKKRAVANKEAALSWKGVDAVKESRFCELSKLEAEFAAELEEIKSFYTPTNLLSLPTSTIASDSVRH